MTECPDDGLLEQLVQGRISNSEERALEDHIGQCSSCQKRLESLAAEQFTTDFGSRPVLLSDSEPHYEALNRAIQHLRSNKPNAHSDSRSTAQILSLLEPSANPDDLGMLGEYSIRGVLGAGGFGVVLDAWDESLNRHVAIKVLSTTFHSLEQAWEVIGLPRCPIRTTTQASGFVMQITTLLRFWWNPESVA